VQRKAFVNSIIDCGSLAWRKQCAMISEKGLLAIWEESAICVITCFRDYADQILLLHQEHVVVQVEKR